MTAVTLALGLLLAACSEPQSALDPEGFYAEEPHQLIIPVAIIALVMFVLVQGLIIYAVVKFRERPDDDGALPVQTHGNTKLEIMWTAIPALILAFIAVPTVQTIFELVDEPADSLTVEVIGHRWWWEYRYPDSGVVTANELVIPTGRTVHLQLTAEESGGPANAVIHSFWIPKLGGKRDAVPGRVNELNIAADEPGRYLGQCAEYCGLSHSMMRARVEALPPDQFEQWLAEQQQDAAEPESGTLAATGKELVVGGACAGCHTINGTGAQGIVGPDLTHLMSRQEFAGAVFRLDEENLLSWIADPNAMKPMRADYGIGMPDLGHSPEEVEAIVAYLMTLE